MAFGSLEIASMPRAMDYTTIKQNEDNRPAFEQVTISQEALKTAEQQPKVVHDSDNAEWHTGQFDARDKGSNEYTGDGGRRKKHEENQDRVIKKEPHGFDIRI